MDPAYDVQQLRLACIDPIQVDYEVIRPVVLEHKTLTARSQETGIDRSVIGEKARRFVQHGMFGLVDQRAQRSGRKAHDYPEPIARYILYLKQISPPIHYREIVRILERKFGYTTNHHTIKRFLERYPIPVQLELNLTPFHAFEDAYRARWTVVRMAYEGWQIQSLANCRKLSRQHGYNLLEAFERDGFAGLEEQRTRPITHPDTQLTLPFLKDVLAVQKEFPRAGRHRVHAILEQRRDGEVPSPATVGRAMAKNRQFHGAPGPWVRNEKPDPTATMIKTLRYEPLYRHHYWFLDIRYLVKLDNEWTYSICILEGYSRKLLAGMASHYQDLVAVLQLFYAALEEYGCPAGLVTDNGAVFRTHEFQAILAALGIAWCPIEQGKPWENLIEAQFKVQVRLADANFEQARSFEELQAHHAAFVQLFNTTRHWAHANREDGRVRRLTC